MTNNFQVTVSIGDGISSIKKLTFPLEEQTLNKVRIAINTL